MAVSRINAIFFIWKHGSIMNGKLIHLSEMLRDRQLKTCRDRLNGWNRNISATEIISVACWNYLRAIERLGNYANVTCWVCMARHVIVNLLRPFTDRILFHFKMEPPAEIILFHCKTISRRNILFHAKITSFQHGNTTLIDLFSSTDMSMFTTSKS